MLAQVGHVPIDKQIPKLETAGAIEFDSERELVGPTAAFERFDPYLSAIVEADPDLESPSNCDLA
jgi:hypothetical protein